MVKYNHPLAKGDRKKNPYSHMCCRFVLKMANVSTTDVRNATHSFSDAVAPRDTHQIPSAGWFARCSPGYRGSYLGNLGSGQRRSSLTTRHHSELTPRAQQGKINKNVRMKLWLTEMWTLNDVNAVYNDMNLVINTLTFLTYGIRNKLKSDVSSFVWCITMNQL